jgi:hypothetical protein
MITTPMSKFTAIQNELNSGFTMTFENGLTVSVQFGTINHCDSGETTAEVAAWGPNFEWINLSEHSPIKMHCSPNDVLEVMNRISKL